MKLIIILAIILFIIVIIWAITTGLKQWNDKRAPWFLEEEESTDGMRWRVKAIKPGHERVLTEWLWTRDYGEISSYVARQEAHTQVQEMNQQQKGLNRG